MSTIKISELATSNIALTDFFAKADATGVASKNTVQELSNLLKTVDDTAFKGSIAIADVPSENGWYFASESGTYTNCGGLVIDTTDNIAIIIVSGTFDTFNKIDIPVNITIDATPTDGSNNAISSNGVFDALALKEDTLTLDVLPENGSTNAVESGGVFDYLNNTTIKQNYYSINQVTDSESINQAGSISTTLGLGLTRIPVLPETTYAFKHSDNSYLYNNETAIFFFDSGLVKIGGNVDVRTLENALGDGGKIITTPANCFFILKNNNQTGRDYRSDFVINLGTSTFPYEAYTTEVSEINNNYLRDNYLRSENDRIKPEENLSKIKGFNYKSESLSQISDTLDQIRTATVEVQNNDSLSLSSPLTLGSSIVITKSYTSDSIISAIKIDLASTTSSGSQYINVFVIDENDVIVQKQGVYQFTFTVAGVYNVVIDDFILPANHFLGFTTSENVKIKYGSNISATSGWRYFGQDTFPDKALDSNFFSQGLLTRFDAVGVGWTATLKTFNSVLNNNYLTGLKIVGIGDSMMEAYNSYAYVNLIAVRNSMNFTNLGISGNRITTTGGTGTAMCDRVTDIPTDTKILVVDCGTNDALNTITIGATSSTNDAEFNGALNKFLDAVLTRIPTAGIIWNGIRQGGADLYNDAIILQCEKRQIPILNNFINGGIYMSNTAQYNALTRQDNIHLSELGIVRQSYKIEGFLKSNIGGFAVI